MADAADAADTPLLVRKTKRAKKFLKTYFPPPKTNIADLRDLSETKPENILMLQDTTEPDVLHIAAHAVADKLKRFAHILIVGGVPVFTNPLTKESFVLQALHSTSTETIGYQTIGYLSRIIDVVTTLKDPRTLAITADIFAMKPMRKTYRDEDTGVLVTKFFAALVSDNDTEMVMEGVTIKPFDVPAANANYPGFLISDGYPVIDGCVIVQTPVGSESAFATADLLRETATVTLAMSEEFERFPIETVVLLVYPSGSTRVVKKGSYVVEVNDYVEQP